MIKIDPMIGLDIDIKNEFGIPEEKVDDKKSDGSDDNNEED